MSRNLKKTLITVLFVVFILCMFMACAKTASVPGKLDYGDADLSGENSAGLEAAAQYTVRYKNGSISVGDVMPFYENGVYSFFYLADGAGISNHPVYRVDTTDFINFTDRGEALPAGESTAQDSMIGTGSIVKANNDYYFFYTGFKKDTPEAVMVAKSSGNLDNFQKIDGFVMRAADIPGCDLQEWDFRDPEAFFEDGHFVLLVSARRDGKPVIAKFTVSEDLRDITYDGVIFSDTRLGANVLECSDLFEIDGKWYLTYSVQDTLNGGADGSDAVNVNVGTNGRMFYAVSDNKYGPFSSIYNSALESHVFYAGKTAQDGERTYLAGWVRNKGSNVGWNYSWGGNLCIHELTANSDGSLSVSAPTSVYDYYSVERELDEALKTYNGYDLILEDKTYHTVSKEYSSYLLTAKVSFDDDVKEFGFALAVSSQTAGIMEITLVPGADKVRSGMVGTQELSSGYVNLVSGREYDLALLTEGSVVTLYIDNTVAYTSRIRNIGNKNIAVFAKDGNVSFSDFHIYTASDYADNLNLGGRLTSDGLTGAVNGFDLAAGQSRKFVYTAEEDNFTEYNIALYSDKNIKVTVNVNGAEESSHTVSAGKLTMLAGGGYIAKGNTAEFIISSEEAAQVLMNLGVGTDKKNEEKSATTEIYGDGAAEFTAGKAGVYSFVASAYISDLSGLPVFTAGNGKAAFENDKNLVTIRGGVYLAAGEKLVGSVIYRQFTADTDGAQVCLAVREGGGEYVSGIGTLVSAISSPEIILVSETVPDLSGDFEISYDRGMGVEMNGEVFGEQGKNGFIYAYGKEADELYPMSEYNTNGEIWEYRHKAPEVNDALEIKADYMKQGGGYVTAVVWTSPADGHIDYRAEYRSNSGVVQVKVLRNRTVLYDAVLKDGNNVAVAELFGIEVKQGDYLILSVRSAGNPAGTSDGNYYLRIGEGNPGAENVEYDPNATLIADYAYDFNTVSQGIYGWQYLSVGYTWDGGERPTDVNELTLNDGVWGNSGTGIDADGVVRGNNVAIGYVNEWDKEITVHFTGKITVAGTPASDVWVRAHVLRTDGSQYQLFGRGFASSTEIKTAAKLNKGDRVMFIFFDNNNGCTVSLKVGCYDEGQVDEAGLAAEIAAAEQITNDDGKYTAESFAALGAALSEAKDVSVTGMTYLELRDVIDGLRTAVSGLMLDTAAAKSELNYQIERARAYLNAEAFMSGSAAEITSQLDAATAVYNDDSKTSQEIIAATAVLKNYLDTVVIKITALADSFGGQGDGGFIYLRSNVSYDGGFHVTDCSELMYSETNQRYEDGELYVSVDKMYISGATLAFRNYSGDTKEFVFNGQATYLGGGSNGAALAYVKMNADGTFTTLSDWHPYSSSASLSISERITLEAGAAFMLVLRDNAGDDTLTGITLEVGTTSAEMDISKTLLSDYIVSVSGINNDDGIYTADSYAAFASAKTAAEGVNVKSDADEGEIYRALTELKAAYKGLAKANAKTSADYTEVIAENSPWKVYQTGINWEPARLNGINDGNLYSYESGALINGTNTVSTGDNALTVGIEGGIAFVFEIEKTGSYTISGTYTGETRGDGRIFKQTNGSGEYLEETSAGWIGTDESFNKTYTLNAGDRIAIQFDGAVNAQISFSITLN